MGSGAAPFIAGCPTPVHSIQHDWHAWNAVITYVRWPPLPSSHCVSDTRWLCIHLCSKHLCILSTSWNISPSRLNTHLFSSHVVYMPNNILTVTRLTWPWSFLLTTCKQNIMTMLRFRALQYLCSVWHFTSVFDMFVLVPAHSGSPGQRAVKWLLLLFYMLPPGVVINDNDNIWIMKEKQMTGCLLWFTFPPNSTVRADGLLSSRIPKTANALLC